MAKWRAVGKKMCRLSASPLSKFEIASTAHQSNTRGVYVTAVLPCLLCWAPVLVTQMRVLFLSSDPIWNKIETLSPPPYGETSTDIPCNSPMKKKNGTHQLQLASSKLQRTHTPFACAAIEAHWVVGAPAWCVWDSC
ncbi:unnamed protein product [Ectocarpus sp. 8 AP-2014]